MKCSLTINEASELALLGTFKEVQKRTKMSESEVTKLNYSAVDVGEKMSNDLISGKYSGAGVLELVYEWKSFFQLYYPETYVQRIEHIEKIEQRVIYQAEMKKGDSPF